MMSQRRRAALVTGAGRNIGRAVVLGLARDGFDVVINGATNRDICESVAQEVRDLGAEALVAMGDVGRLEDCARIAAEAISRFGTVDVLVNNAAIRPVKPFLETSEAEWRRVLAVDLDSAVWLARACLPGMVEQGWGRIVSITGLNAIHGHEGRVPVSVAKHGVWGLTKALAKEFGPKGITVNAISPGAIAADGEQPADDPARRAVIARIPAGRLGLPAEIASVLRLLVSDGGAFVNGQMFQVNGGAQT